MKFSTSNIVHELQPKKMGTWLYQCAEVSISTITKSISHFLLSSLFWKLYQPSGQDQQNGKHTVNYHPSPSELISRIQPLIFLWTPKGFISPEYFLNFFLNLYNPPWLQKSSKLIVSRLLQVQLSQKIESVHFTYAPSKTHCQVFIIIPQVGENSPFPPNSIFWRYFFPQKERGRVTELWSWKN